MNRVRLQFLGGVLSMLLAMMTPNATAQEAVDALKAEAAEHYSERSYRLAFEAWKKASDLGVPEADRPKLEFFMADALWRSRPSAEELTEARNRLEALAKAHPESALSAEAWESLADSWLATERDWPTAWELYQRALKFWAASENLDVARDRYLGIVWKATGPPDDADRAAILPLEVLTNALRIAKTPENQARARYFLGVWFAGRGDPFSLRRAGREWSQVVTAGPSSAVYEAALFRLAQWSLQAGSSNWLPDGNLEVTANYPRAYTLFRKFLEEFPKGRSPFSEEAARQLEELVRPELDISTPSAYLPGSEPMVLMNLRNVPVVEMGLYSVDFQQDFAPSGQTDPDQWVGALRLEPSAQVKVWQESASPPQAFRPARREVTLDAIEKPGAYVLEAKGAGRVARTLILVTNVAVIAKPSRNALVAMMADVRSGEAQKAPSASLWNATRGEKGWLWSRVDAPTAGPDGLLQFDLKGQKSDGMRSLLLFANSGDSQAFLESRSLPSQPDSAAWKIQVFGDRTAARPDEWLGWKMIARRTESGRLVTPVGHELAWKLFTPSGDVAREGRVKLSDFGGAWGRFDFTEADPLGEYRMEFYDGDQAIGSETVFRLEEYRLPDFQVLLELAGQSGRVGRLGDPLRVRLKAGYFSGGPVPDARVEVIIRESPYERLRPLARMGFADVMPHRGTASARVIRKEEVRTAPDGSVLIEVETPPDSPVDLLYEIEARVVSAAGSEVAGRREFVIARQGYFADVTVPRRLASPGDRVRIRIDTRDANGTAVQAKGTLTIQRENWTEVWLSPDGREVTGEELDALRQDVFPPRGTAGWRVKSREYRSTEVQQVEVGTNASGQGGIEFDASETGFYRMIWAGADGDGPPVRGEANLWVSDAATRMIGYRTGGIEILVDPQSLDGDAPVPALLVTDATRRDVFFTVDAGDDLFRSEIIRMDGNAQLVQLERDPRYVPNVFLTAAMIRGGDFLQDQAMVEFPNRRNRLTVELTTGEGTVAPGSGGEVTIRVRDADGRPVDSEVAFSVTDAAVREIQDDYTGDPLEFFLGGMRGPGSPVTSSLSARAVLFETRRIRDQAAAENSTVANPAAYSVSALAVPMIADASERSMALDASDASEKQTFSGVVRKDFRTTALWRPDLVTGSNGDATAGFSYPDTLTSWRMVARVAGRGDQFGFAELETRTSLPLIARLNAPRFLVKDDAFGVRAGIDNQTSEALRVKVALTVENLTGDSTVKDLRLSAGASGSVDWMLSAPAFGKGRMQLTAQSGERQDGMEVTIPIQDKGVPISVWSSGSLGAAEKTTSASVDVPQDGIPGSSSLEITASTSLIGTILDALPFLMDSQSVRVEGIVSRFLPAAATLRTLQVLGASPEQTAERIFSTSRNPLGGREALSKVEDGVKQGLQQVYDRQNSDGSWSWWRGGDADPYMTAYILWGLRIAQASGVGVREDKLDAAAKYLRDTLIGTANQPDLQAWILHALTAGRPAQKRAAPEETAAMNLLWENRDALSPYGRAVYALALFRAGQTQRATTLARNMRDGAARETDAVPNRAETVFWRATGGYPGKFSSNIEATAFAVEALQAIDPKSELIQPALRWLMINRRGAAWSNSRDSAIVVLALNGSIAADAQADSTYEVTVNGERIAEVRGQGLLPQAGSFTVGSDKLKQGANEVRIRRTGGDGPIFFTTSLRYVSVADSLEPEASSLGIRREYLRYAAHETLLDGYRYEKSPWPEETSVPVNMRTETVLTLKASTDLAYIRVRDRFPAGLEPSISVSGPSFMATNEAGETLPVYVQVRDDSLDMFIENLPQGEWLIRYDMRTAFSGNFAARPATIEGVYAPDFSGSSSSRRIKIEP